MTTHLISRFGRQPKLFNYWETQPNPTIDDNEIKLGQLSLEQIARQETCKLQQMLDFHFHTRKLRERDTG